MRWGCCSPSARHIHTGRDRQRAHEWRGMISDLGRREEELAGKTMVIYGFGAIGSRLARLARAFDMTVIGVKRDTANHDGSADEMRPPDEFLASLAEVRRRRADMSADAADRGPDRCAGAGSDEARCVPDQCRARALRQRAGSRRGPRARRDRRRGHRHHLGGAAGPRLQAVGPRECTESRPIPPARPGSTKTTWWTSSSRTSAACSEARAGSSTRSSEEVCVRRDTTQHPARIRRHHSAANAVPSPGSTRECMGYRRRRRRMSMSARGSSPFAI